MRFLAIAAVLILLLGCVLPGQNTGGKNTSTTQYPNQNNPYNPSLPSQGQGQQTNTQSSAQQAGNQTSTLASEEISYDASGWTIYGTLYPSQGRNPTILVVLVPGLGTTRDSYPQDFIVRLHDAMPDALILAIDPKGHGKSTNLGSWHDFDQALFLDMRSDLIYVKPYIVDRYPTVKNIYAVGASMGSTSALMAAVKEKYITKVAMLSPGMAFNKVDITSSDGLNKYMLPLLVVASYGDAYSAQSASQIYSLTSESQTTLKLYPGSAHGTALFEATKDDPTPVADLLIDFLKK
jgi:pimeloyl-ACP methyl ester carboxylesterase